jgi:hypothetical protein
MAMTVPVAAPTIIDTTMPTIAIVPTGNVIALSAESFRFIQQAYSH